MMNVFLQRKMITLDGESLTCDDVYAIAKGGCNVQLSSEAKQRLVDSKQDTGSLPPFSPFIVVNSFIFANSSIVANSFIHSFVANRCWKS